MFKKFINKLFGNSKPSGTNEGTVKFFSTKKGFGFITLKDSEDEIFVHANNLIDRIKDKNKVTFNIEKSPKGPIATNVRLVKK